MAHFKRALPNKRGHETFSCDGNLFTDGVGSADDQLVGGNLACRRPKQIATGLWRAEQRQPPMMPKAVMAGLAARMSVIT